MRISMPVLGASLLGFLSLSFSISLPTTRPFVSRRECVWEWFSLIWLCTYIHCRGDSLCVCVCVRASNKILCLSHTFEYAFWRFVYLRLPFLSSVFHTCFIPSICLPFTRARRTAEISDIVANKLIYYYSLLGIRHFGGCLACTTGRMRDMPVIGIYCDQLTEIIRRSPAEYLLKLLGCFGNI